MVDGTCSVAGCDTTATARVVDYGGDVATPCEQHYKGTMDVLIGAGCVEGCPDDESVQEEEERGDEPDEGE